MPKGHPPLLLMYYPRMFANSFINSRTYTLIHIVKWEVLITITADHSDILRIILFQKITFKGKLINPEALKHTQGIPIGRVADDRILSITNFRKNCLDPVSIKRIIVHLTIIFCRNTQYIILLLIPKKSIILAIFRHYFHFRMLKKIRQQSPEIE